MQLKSILILFSFIVLTSCEINLCERHLEDWAKDAPSAFQEFQSVKEELKNHPTLVKNYTVNGNFFLKYLDIKNITGFKIPNLKKWFSNGRGYISFSKTDTSICYQSCVSGPGTAYAIIHSSNNVNNYKKGVKIVNTIKLQNNWEAVITKCYGCLD